MSNVNEGLFKFSEAKEELKDLKASGVTAIAERRGLNDEFTIKEILTQENGKETQGKGKKSKKKSKKQIDSKLKKILKQKVKVRKVLKRQPELKVKIEDKEVESVFDDPNRFFKNEMEEVKKQLFFK